MSLKHPSSSAWYNKVWHVSCFSTNAFSWLHLLKKSFFSLLLLQFRQYIKQKRLLKPQLKKYSLVPMFLNLLSTITRAHTATPAYLSCTHRHQTPEISHHAYICSPPSSSTIFVNSQCLLISGRHTFIDALQTLWTSPPLPGTSLMHAQAERAPCTAK